MSGHVQRRVHVLAARAYRACLLAHAAEALFVGLLGLLLALTAVAWQGSALASLGAWGAAILAGVCAGAAWWLEVRPARSVIARRIDTELGLDGAFFTVFEQGDPERAAGRGLVTQLLAQAVGEALSPARVLRCALPNSMPFLALPFLGATLLAMVRAAEPPAPVAPDWVPRVAALTEALDAADVAAREGMRSGEIDGQTLRELVDLKGRSRELLRGARTGASGPDEARAELADLRDDLERIASDASPLSELAVALDEAATRADALMMGDPESVAAGTPGQARSGSMATGGGEGAPAPGEAGREGTHSESAPEADPRLANGGSEGRMKDGSVRNGGADAPGAGHSPGAAGGAVEPGALPEPQVEQGAGSPGSAGVASGRWWSERDAAIVERWVQWRRGADPGAETRDEDD
ncbi:MAG: hypothetical protein ACI8Y8_002169 [Planctomycetota bacterium]|jgi:hypothetical protein